LPLPDSPGVEATECIGPYTSLSVRYNYYCLGNVMGPCRIAISVGSLRNDSFNQTPEQFEAEWQLSWTAKEGIF
jgi:hypothetical protein